MQADLQPVLTLVKSGVVIANARSNVRHALSSRVAKFCVGVGPFGMGVGPFDLKLAESDHAHHDHKKQLDFDPTLK